MKGPGYRYDIDVRRTWQCPGCGNRVRSQGQATARLCRCTDAGTWMKLVDENVRRTFPERQRIVIPDPNADPEEPSAPPVDAVQEEIPAEASAAPEATAPAVDTEDVATQRTPAPATDATPDGSAEAGQKAESFETTTSRRRRDKKRRGKKNKRRGNDTDEALAAGDAAPTSPPSAETFTPPSVEPSPAPAIESQPPASSGDGGFGENVFD